MTQPDRPHRATLFAWMPSLYAQATDDVPVRTRRWCAIVMIPIAMLCCLAQCAYAAKQYEHDPRNVMYTVMIIATLIAFAVPFILLKRSEYPEPVFWISCAIVAIAPYSPMLMFMALTSLLARRHDHNRTLRAVVAGTMVAVWAQMRDAYQPADASFWHMVFAVPGTGVNDIPIESTVGDVTIIVIAAVTGMIETLIAVFVGLHIRSKAVLHEADARTDAATHHAEHLQSALNSQQLADAIAAEAHDTLAHSLSLIALNASALQAEASSLPESPQTQAIVRTAETIRRQSAGALDEAHAIIAMLRNPEQARQQLAPSTDTSLTRDSLDALIADVRNAGMQLNTWIDIVQLSSLDDETAKVAYRAIQESLTNARRHAPGAPASLEVTANPQSGVHVHVSNPIVAQQPSSATASSTTPAPGTVHAFNGTAHAPSDTAHAPSDAAYAPGSAAHASAALPPPDAATRHSGSIPAPDAPRPRGGAGLPGLAARVRAAGGTCRYGADDRNVFHVDVTLPWSQPQTQSRPRDAAV